MKKLEKSRIEMNIELPAELVDTEYNEVFKKLQKSVKVDGFRKGKAPFQLVESRYKEAATEEVSENLAQKGFFDAVTENQLNPITRPNYDFEGAIQGEPFKYVATFEVAPTIEIGKYKDIAVSEKACKIIDADIDDEIDALRERDAKTDVKGEDGTVQNGDFVKIKVKRVDDVDDDKVEAVPFKDYAIICGKSKDPSALDKHIVDMKIGDEKDVDVKYPKDYYIEDLSGQKVTYKVCIEEISDMELPELNDEYAKKLNYESVDDMSAKTKENIEKFVTEKIRGEAKGELLKNIVENSKFDIPESMIYSEMNSIFRKTQERIGFQAESLEQFSQMLGMNPEEFKGKLEEEATQSIRTTLVLSEIAKKEEFKVTEEKYQEILERIAKSNNQSVQEIEALIEKNQSRENIESELILDQAMDFIYDNGKVKKLKAVPYDEFMRSMNQQ